MVLYCWRSDTTQLHRLTRRKAIDLPYSGIFFLDTNFPEFHEWVQNFILGSCISSIVGRYCIIWLWRNKAIMSIDPIIIYFSNESYKPNLLDCRDSVSSKIL